MLSYEFALTLLKDWSCHYSAATHWIFHEATRKLATLAVLSIDLFDAAILLQKGHRCEKQCSKEAHNRRNNLEQPHKHETSKPCKPNKLVGLIQIILGFDVIFLVELVLFELEYGGEANVRFVEWNEPYAEHLRHSNVKDAVGRIVSCMKPVSGSPYRRTERMGTNGVDIDINVRTHDFIPSVNGAYKKSRSVEAVRTTEWMHEGCIIREIGLDRSSLNSRR